MKLLLDTHALLWALGDTARLSRRAKNAFLDPANDVLLSAASVWEMAIKVSLDKLRLPDTLERFVAAHVRGNGIQLLDVDLSHLYLIERLPHHHGDPFDRLLVAQAMVENLPILSSDAAFDAYPVRRVW